MFLSFRESLFLLLVYMQVQRLLMMETTERWGVALRSFQSWYVWGDHLNIWSDGEDCRSMGHSGYGNTHLISLIANMIWFHTYHHRYEWAFWISLDAIVSIFLMLHSFIHGTCFSSNPWTMNFSIQLAFTRFCFFCCDFFDSFKFLLPIVTGYIPVF